MQHFLKPAGGTARAGIIATELFPQLFVAVHDAEAAFDLRFRRETFTTLAGALEKRARPDVGDDVA
jgi:hypothetical protein